MVKGQGWLKRPWVVSKGVCVADPPLSPSPPSSLTWCIIRCSYVLTMKIPSATPARLPDFVEPMKAKLVGSMPAGNWIYEIKFDGYRALALRGLKARTAFESGWGIGWRSLGCKSLLLPWRYTKKWYDEAHGRSASRPHWRLVQRF